MNAADLIRRNSEAINVLMVTRKDGGKKYTYAEILTLLKLEVTTATLHAMSDYAVSKGIRRRKHTPRSTPKESPETTEVVEIETLFKPTDKERFLSACRAFADIYFKED